MRLQSDKKPKLLSLNGEIFAVERPAIGEGSFGKVFKGYRKKDNKPVAIKVIPRDKIDHNARLLANLRTEVQILQRRDIDRTHILELYAFHMSKNKYYIVMDFCAGGDLADYIKKVSKGPIKEHIVRKFTVHIARAMKILRDLRIVHRDLKPLNLLLTTSNADEAIVKIADFGFAREMNKNSLIETCCGSPMYMAPEILDGMKYTSVADLWSIGVIIYEMLTGVPPFTANNLYEFVQVMHKNNVVIPSNISPEARDLLSRLLQKDYRKRMSFDEFFRHPFISKYSESSQPAISPSPSPVAESNPYLQDIVNVHQQLSFYQPVDLQNDAAPSAPTATTTTTSSDKMDESAEDDEFVVIESNTLSPSPIPVVASPAPAEDPVQLKLLDEIDNIFQRASAAFQVGDMCAGNPFTNMSAEGLSIFIKALELLNVGLNKYYTEANADKQSPALAERGANIIASLRNKFTEYVDKAHKLASTVPVPNNVDMKVAEVVYKQALEIAKSAAFNEYSNASLSSPQYTSAKLLFEFLLYHSPLMKAQQDKQKLLGYIDICDKKLASLKK